MSVSYSSAETTIQGARERAAAKMAEAAAKADPTSRLSIAWHFATNCQIVNKAADWERPVPNKHQLKLDMIVEYCLANNLPCWILALKPRQKGSSTKSTHTVYHQARKRRLNALILADKEDTTHLMLKMVDNHSERDDYAWGNEIYVKTEGAECTNGSVITGLTAGGKDPGIGGTRQIGLFTEVAKYGDDTKKLSAEAVMLSVLPSIPRIPGSIVIAETTANGIGGWFHDHYAGNKEKDNAGAVTFEEFLGDPARGIAPKRGNGWIKVFTAWFEFPDSVLERNADTDEWFTKRPDPTSSEGVREALLVARYHVTEAQLAWRRMTIASLCGGNPRGFDQEFPEDDVTAFLVSGAPAFDFNGLAKIAAEAAVNLPEHYVLTEQKQAVGPPKILLQRRDKGQGWFWMWEKPRVGCSYIIGGDVCTGADMTKGKGRGSVTDSHGIGVFRAKYRDARGNVHRKKLVGRLEPACKWDHDILAERIDLLSRFYGGANGANRVTVVIERNGPGASVINALRRLGVPLWVARHWDKLSNKSTDVYGWLTDEKNRARGMATLGQDIRDNAIEVLCTSCAGQLQRAIVDPDGKIVGGPGAHDDDVLMLMILDECENDGTMCVDPDDIPDTDFAGDYGEYEGDSGVYRPPGA